MTTKIERDTALAELRALCPPGTTVYTILRSVSRSGMSRVIDPYIIRDGEPKCIGMLVADALGWSLTKGCEGIKVGGCGMDMGFHLVNSLSYALHGHDAANIDRIRTRDCLVIDNPDNLRPGYTLTHRWL